MEGSIPEQLARDLLFCICAFALFVLYSLRHCHRHGQLVYSNSVFETAPELG